MTIRTKLILWYSGLVAFIIIMFGVATFSFIRWTLITTMDQTLTETANYVVEESRAFMVGEFSSPSNVSVQLPPLDTFRASGVYVQAWDLSGDEVQPAAEAYPNIDDLTIPMDPEMLHTTDPSYHNVQFGDAELRVLTRPVPVPNGMVVLQFATSLETVNQAMDQLLTIMTVCMGLAVIGSIVVGLLISSRALEPIDDITHAAARITQTDDLSTRLPLLGPMDEMGRLTSVFNKMMDRLEHLFGVQRRFVADVSHELRTPLTAIRGNLELIERYGPDETSIGATISEVDRLSRMVNDLLMLARADYGGMQLDLEPMELDTVVMAAYRESLSLVRARDAQLDVRLGRFEPVRVNGNADRIMQLLLNLVGNAIKFTPPNGEIKLSLTDEGEYAVIRVADTGIGIAEEDLPMVFDRFYQAESSRANTDTDMGTGLGLSICQWIAEAHGGDIRVDSQVGHGTTFAVAIPKMEYTAATETRIKVTPAMREMYHANSAGTTKDSYPKSQRKNSGVQANYTNGNG